MDNGYNGWSNRDTWLVMLWLNNDEKNYTAIEHLRKGVGSKYRIEDLSCCELMSRLKRLNYKDKINWHNVNMEEVKEALIREW